LSFKRGLPIKGTKRIKAGQRGCHDSGDQIQGIKSETPPLFQGISVAEIESANPRRSTTQKEGDSAWGVTGYLSKKQPRQFLNGRPIQGDSSGIQSSRLLA
jgi:hypothetical protein